MSSLPDRDRGGDDGWRRNLEQKLESLKALPSGSDSWTPHRPSDEMIALARTVIAKIGRDLPSPIVAAASNGTIQLKWRKTDLEISFFIYPDNTLEYLYRSNYSGRKSGDLNLSAVNDLLAEF